jgi:prepilin-type N-terminal cleavage/methylation domain-containing protein
MIIRSTSRLPKPQRGFTILESIVVLGLIALISAGAYVALNGQNSGANAAEARSSLVHLLKLQTVTPDAPVADTGVLGELDPNRNYVTGVSSDTNEVSVEIVTDVLAAAVYDGVDCWMLLRNYASTTVSGQQIWAVERNSANCSAAHALAVVDEDPSGERGTSVKTPRIL